MIILDRKGGVPLYHQIYEHIRDEVIAGELKEGYRLLPTRIQAEQLGVSRNTVELAYEQLCSEGYLDNRPGSGYYVNFIDTAPLSSSYRKRTNEKPVEPLAEQYLYDMKYGSLALEDFPAEKWKKALDRAMLQQEAKSLTQYGDPCGDWILRQQLAQYLEKSRGVICKPSQIIIGSGTQYLLGLIIQLLGARQVAVEDPGYDGIRHVLENHQVKVAPVALEQGGIDLDSLKQNNVNAVYVTPSHQFPMGMVMPVQKRLELIKWAQDNHSYIIEDDYDSVFRYSTKAIPAMQGMDRSGKVMYLGSLSKALSPALRMAYLILPHDLKEEYDRRFYAYHNTVPSILQTGLRIFMEEGHWERHLRKICLANKRKQELFINHFEKAALSGFQLIGKGAGLHLIIKSEQLTSEEMMLRAEKKGVKVYSLNQYYFQEGWESHMIMAGFGGLSLEETERAAQLLLESLKLA